MPKLLIHASTITAVALAAGAARAQNAQYTCENGSLIRRVVIEAGNAQTGLPCEVIYWKDTEAPGVRRVLWNARSDRSFCDSKALGLVETLTSAGWTCQPPSGTSPLQSTGQPASPIPEAPVEEPATPPAETTASLSASAKAAVPSASRPPGLEAVIAENVESLNQSVDGDFKAEIGEYGDLNGDGLEDVVVFFNYQSSTADFTQFVAAYLNNGRSYHLAATKPVGGSDREADQAEIENIENGLIRLRLRQTDAPGGQVTQTAVMLKDGQLVEVE